MGRREEDWRWEGMEGEGRMGGTEEEIGGRKGTEAGLGIGMMRKRRNRWEEKMGDEERKIEEEYSIRYNMYNSSICMYKI